MRIQTTDPINGKDVTVNERTPFVVEGSGEDALKIYFNSDENRQIYLAVETEALGGHSVEQALGLLAEPVQGLRGRRDHSLGLTGYSLALRVHADR